MKLTPAQHMDVTVAEERALIALVQAASTAAEASNAVVRSAGLSPSQYNVLRILHTAGHEGLTRTDVADRMVTRDPDMTRIIRGLEAKALVKTWSSESDRRRRVSAATAKGRSLLTKLDPSVTAAARESLGHLSESKLELLIDLLGEVVAGRASSGRQPSNA